MNHRLPLNEGLSGAVIEMSYEFGGASVIKKAPNIERQAHYMRAIGEHLFPKIYFIGPSFYCMERLERYVHVSKTAACETLLKLLKEGFWNRPAAIQQSWDPEALNRWFGFLVHPSAAELQCCFRELVHRPIPVEVLTHGDPTVANLMRRSNEDTPCFIDPLPPKDRVPSWICVDQAKVLQSWFGWEPMLRDVSAQQWYGRDHRVGDHMRKAMEDPWVWFWFAVHAARILPYTKDEKIIKWCGNAIEKATLECSQSL